MSRFAVFLLCFEFEPCIGIDGPLAPKDDVLPVFCWLILRVDLIGLIACFYECLDDCLLCYCWPTAETATGWIDSS